MGKSSSQTIGYEYYLGVHGGLVHGPIDSIKRLRFDEKVAWCGISWGGQIEVSARDLFGGKRKEGGVSGLIDFEPGDITQTQNDYLNTQLAGDPVPAFRNIAALVFRQFYFGMSPYLKTWDVRATRIFTKTDGEEQWYPLKAAIGPCGVDYFAFNVLDWAYTDGGGQIEGFADNGSGLWLAMRFSSTNFFVYKSTDDARTFVSTGIQAGDFGSKYVGYDPVANLFVLGCGTAIRSTADGESFTSHGRDGEVIGSGGVFAYADHWFMNTGSTTTKYSSDRGVSWEVVPVINGIDQVNTVVLDGWIYAKTGQNQVAKSPVGSPLSWTVITPGGSGGSISVSAFGEVRGVLYALKSFDTFKVYRSFDKGDTWEGMSISPFGTNATTFSAGFRNRLGVIEIQTDQLGRTWIMSNDGFNWVVATGRPPNWTFIWIGSQSILVSSPSSSSGTAGSKRVQYAEEDECYVQPCDMNPSHIIREILTDPAWGMAYPESDVDDTSFTSAADQLFDEGMGISLVWDRQRTIEDFLDLIIEHIDAVLYVSRSTGKFVLKLIRDDYSEGSLLTLGEDEIERVEDFKRPTTGELVSAVSVTYWDSVTSKDASVAVHDQALAVQQGGAIWTTSSYPGFTNRDIATQVAFRDLRALSVPLRACTVYATRKASGLNPGDAFKLDWPQLIDDGPIIMRVTGIALGDGRTNRVRIQCVEDVFSVGPAPIISDMPTKWEDPATSPAAIARQKIFEAPYWSLARQFGQAQAENTLSFNDAAGFLMATAQQPAIGSLNAEVHVDTGAGYVDEFVTDYAPWATLSAAVAPLDTVLSVENESALDEAVIGQLAFLGDELVRIDAVGTGASTITVGRGCLDTVPAEHAIGTSLALWADFAEIGTDEYSDGESINVKLLPSNSTISLASVTPEALTLDARAIRPLPPGNFKINSEAYPTFLNIPNPDADNAISVSWSHRDRKLQTAESIDDTTAANIGPETGTTYTVELINTLDESTFASATAVAGTSSDFALTGYTQESLRVKLKSVRDAFDSFQIHDWTFLLGDDWTPAAATTGLWIDAADTSTITEVSGEVSAVADKSGNGRNLAQGTSSLRPSTGVLTLNGKNVLGFSSDYLISTSAASEWTFLHDGTVHRIFAVTRFGNTADPDAFMGLLGTSATASANRGMFVGFDDRAAQSANNRLLLWASRAQNGTYQTRLDTANDVYPANEFGILEAFCDFSAAAADRAKFVINAVDDPAVNAQTGAVNTSAPSFTLYVGTPGGTSFSLSGAIAELCIVVGADASNTTVTEKMQGYLAHKWGLTANLPSGHTYKTDPPTV